MVRTLKILFRRDPARNRQLNDVNMDGFELLWPDGRPVASGLDAFCRAAQGILGLNRFMIGREERLLELIQFPLRSKEEQLVRVTGLRVRRLMIRRAGPVGRIHLINGAATAVTFEMGRDERRILDWVGLTGLRDGEHLWFDITVRAVDTVTEHAPLWNEAASPFFPAVSAGS
jgi:hypothetical protein